MPARPLPEEDAKLAALLLAVDPTGLGGVSLRGMPDPARDEWLTFFLERLGDEAARVKVPINASTESLVGGLDFAATIHSGRPVHETGLLEQAGGGCLVLAMAERMPLSNAAIIGEALETGEFRVERDGLHRRVPSTFCVVALDEGIDDEQIPERLAERLAFRLEVAAFRDVDFEDGEFPATDIRAARRRLGELPATPAIIEALSRAARAFGVDSMRADLFMLRAARAAAALSGASAVADEHAALAARLVLSHRATRTPAEPPPPPPQEDVQEEEEQDPAKSSSSDMPEEVLVEAILASLPHDMLERLRLGVSNRRQAGAGGRGGPAAKSRLRGRPIGTEAKDNTRGSRLNVLATLKAAAPWQRLRAQQSPRRTRLYLRREDIHVTRFEDRVETTTIFVVDASGSQAAQRLAEVKGAIELLLHQCYVRRDQVALIAFRRDGSEVLLQPTRALARVKRSLSALPGGGGTPLASGLDHARELAAAVVAQGRVPAVVLMTDGRANIARDGTPGADRAAHDAEHAARLFRVDGVRSVLVDSSRRPRPRAQSLAREMGAEYVALPRADAARISNTVQQRLSS